MQLTRFLLGIGLVMLLLACNRNRDPGPDPTLPTTNCGELVTGNVTVTTGDLYTIESAFMSWDVLFLNISYTGGCTDHCFQLSWSGSVPATNGGDVWLFLSHNSFGDDCETFVTEEIGFDLTSMKNAILNQNNNIDQVNINIENYFPAQPLVYSF